MTRNDDIICIGYGVTGKATAYTLDIPRENCIDLDNKSDFASKYVYVLCLPTPTINGIQDISAIDEWLDKISKENKNALVILRSTVLPGTTEKLIEKYKLNIVFVPEFLTESTALEDAKEPEFMVVGTDDILLRRKVYEIFLPYVKAKSWIYCSPTTAEMVKYTMNCFFALKVIYANQLWDISRNVGANYEILKQALEIHKWGSMNGWNVWHKGGRGASGKCLPKDIDAFTTFTNSSLMRTVKELNDELLKQYPKSK